MSGYEYIALVGTPHEMKVHGKGEPNAINTCKTLCKLIDKEFMPTAKKFDWPARDALVAVKEEIMKVYTIAPDDHREWRVAYMNTTVAFRMEWRKQ